ncbi:hypothetical protein LCGC14_0412640 [marine sediment metagenome]|uniref:Uncharacterized protein n=1 Tax=marine sediment metagenome TaxID=412755 RepID=A0A0F9W2Q2_9ZZZZ
MIANRVGKPTEGCAVGLAAWLVAKAKGAE